MTPQAKRAHEIWRQSDIAYCERLYDEKIFSILVNRIDKSFDADMLEFQNGAFTIDEDDVIARSSLIYGGGGIGDLYDALLLRYEKAGLLKYEAFPLVYECEEENEGRSYWHDWFKAFRGRSKKEDKFLDSLVDLISDYMDDLDGEGLLIRFDVIGDFYRFLSKQRVEKSDEKDAEELKLWCSELTHLFACKETCYSDADRVVTKKGVLGYFLAYPDNYSGYGGVAQRIDAFSFFLIYAVCEGIMALNKKYKFLTCNTAQETKAKAA